MKNQKTENVFFTASTIVEVEDNEVITNSPNEKPEFYY